jgi:SOS-response transcriptional repressor LexA
MSPKQQALILAISRLTSSRGFPPSTAELAKELGVSKTRVEQLAIACQQQGAISRERRVARSWRVLRTA